MKANLELAVSGNSADARGHILRFDRQTLAFTGEIVSTRMASALAVTNDDKVVVGFESGRIAQLDVSALMLRTLGTVEGVPIWIGSAPNGELVSVYAQSGVRPVAWAPMGPYWHRMRWMGSGREVRIFAATTFFRDSTGRVWLGADRGEWGGGIEVVDLNNGTHRKLDVANNVYGFAELASGEVWAYGGLMHMGLIETYVARVSLKGTFKYLFKSEHAALFDGADTRRWRRESHPHLPITHIVATTSDKLAVFAYNEVFEAGVRLNDFRQIAKLSLDYETGRPDAVGTYPAVRAVHSERSGFVLATGRNGLVSLQGDKVASHAIRGQVCPTVEYTLTAGQNVVAVGFGSEPTLWRVDHWQTVPARWGEELEHGPPAPFGSDQALVESLLLRRSQSHDRDESNPALATHFPTLADQADKTARDESGRTWLAGRGLWFVDGAQRLFAVHPHLPFMGDADVYDIAVNNQRLFLSLRHRGLAILNLADLRVVGGEESPPSIAEWDRRQPHEPKPSDGVVAVVDRSSSADRDIEIWNALDATAMAFRSAHRADLWSERSRVGGYVFAAFGSSKPGELAQRILEQSRADLKRHGFALLVRQGPARSPFEEVGP